MRRYFELGRPTRQWRSNSIQMGLGWFSFEAWLDTGYEGSLFEYAYELRLGSWHHSFRWSR